MRDKLNNLVLFDKATYDKLCKEVPNYKLITPAVVSERLKIRGSLARAALQELLSKGKRSKPRQNTELLELEVVFFLQDFVLHVKYANWHVLLKAVASACISKVQQSKEGTLLCLVIRLCGGSHVRGMGRDAAAPGLEHKPCVHVLVTKCC